MPSSDSEHPSPERSLERTTELAETRKRERAAFNAAFTAFVESFGKEMPSITARSLAGTEHVHGRLMVLHYDDGTRDAMPVRVLMSFGPASALESVDAAVAALADAPSFEGRNVTIMPSGEAELQSICLRALALLDLSAELPPSAALNRVSEAAALLRTAL